MKTVLAVLIGGLLGNALRLATDVALPHGPGEFPLSTLLVNTVGALALGYLVARLWPIAPPWLKAGLGGGLLGSFTTFSAVIVSVSAFALDGRWLLLAGYLLATLTLGLSAAYAGLRWGSRWGSRERSRP